MVLIRSERKLRHPVHWQHDVVRWAHQDDLIIALVPSRNDFDVAFELVRVKLEEFRRQELATSGRLVLDTAGAWIWPDSRVIDFDRYTRQYNLARLRIALALADGESLEAAGNRQFAEHSEVLAWAQRALLDR